MVDIVDFNNDNNINNKIKQHKEQKRTIHDMNTSLEMYTIEKKDNYNKSKKNKPKEVPENWLDVPKMGQIIGSHRIIALRVPLDNSYNSKLDEKDRWTPQMFMEEQKKLGYNVKMIIDLTNTTKYYRKNEFENVIEYHKLPIKGFSNVPSEKDVQMFFNLMDTFFKNDLNELDEKNHIEKNIKDIKSQFICENKTFIHIKNNQFLNENNIKQDKNNGVVAIHCTHGLNRTGYMIVSFLVNRYGYSITESLDLFATYRPPGLIKQMYIEELYKRYGRKDEKLVMKPLPMWAIEKYSSKKKTINEKTDINTN